MNRVVHFRDLGEIDYQEAWDYQTRIFDETVGKKIFLRNHPDSDDQTLNHLVFCSHPHVYTLGKSGDEDHLLISEYLMAQKQIKFFRINRGGDITYHGPGQIVGYPILDLDHFFTDVHKYLRTLEEAVILTLGDYGVKGHRIEGLTGIWIDPNNNPRKICALGVKMSRWVTMHGFAFNINVDLDYYQYIVPCGINDKQVTSLDIELGEDVNIEETKSRLLTHLSNVFQMQVAHDQ